MKMNFAKLFVCGMCLKLFKGWIYFYGRGSITSTNMSNFKKQKLPWFYHPCKLAKPSATVYLCAVLFPGSFKDNVEPHFLQQIWQDFSHTILEMWGVAKGSHWRKNLHEHIEHFFIYKTCPCLWNPVKWSHYTQIVSLISFLTCLTLGNMKDIIIICLQAVL